MDEYAVEQPAEAAPAAVDPRRALLLPVWRGRYLVLALTLLGIVGGVLAGITRPNTYRSYGKLMIRAGAREEGSLERSLTGGGGGFGITGRDIVNNELHLLGGMQVFEETARIVTPAEVFRPYDPSDQDDDNTSAVLAMFHGWQSWWFKNASSPNDLPRHPIDNCTECVHAAALVLTRNLGMQGEPGSNVITVSYTTHDAALAQKVVAAFLEAAILHHRKVYETNTSLEYLSGLMERYLKDLTSAENDFTNFENECGVYDFATQQQALLTAIGLLENQTLDDKGRLEEFRSRAQLLEAQVAQLPERIDDTTEHNRVPNPDRGLLQQNIFTLKRELADLDRQVGGTSAQRDAQRASITHEIQSQQLELQNLPEFVDAGPSVRSVPNARRERLMQQLDDAKQELTSLEAAAAVRAGQLVDQRGQMQRVANCGPRYNSLREKVNQARVNYERFRAEHERTSLLGSMDQLGMSNLRRIQEASLPDEKEGPMRGKLLVLGLLLGAVAGCGLAFVKHMLDHRLHDATEVEQLLGSTVLAVFPEAGSRAKSSKRASRRAAL